MKRELLKTFLTIAIYLAIMSPIYFFEPFKESTCKSECPDPEPYVWVIPYFMFIVFISGWGLLDLIKKLVIKYFFKNE